MTGVWAEWWVVWQVCIAWMMSFVTGVFGLNDELYDRWALPEWWISLQVSVGWVVSFMTGVHCLDGCLICWSDGHYDVWLFGLSDMGYDLSYGLGWWILWHWLVSIDECLMSYYDGGVCVVWVMSILSVVGSLKCEYCDRCLCGLIDEYCDSCGPNHVMNINGRPLWTEWWVLRCTWPKWYITL